MTALSGQPILSFLPPVVASSDADGGGLSSHPCRAARAQVRGVARGAECDHLGVPKNTLYRWRTKGYGPAGRRIGKHVRYRPEDVDAWVEQQGAA